jgi:predicted site-specific integrase-resolvase
MNNNIYTVKSAAELLKSNPQSIRRLINEGKLKASKKLNKWYILHSDILEYLKGSDNDG